MDTNINPEEGQPVAQETPTPPADMSTTNQTPAADQSQKTEAKPTEVLFAEEALGRQFDSKEDALKALKNLNSMVGDQTIAKQRKALEKIAQQSQMTPDELIAVLENQTVTEQPDAPAQPAQATQPADTSKRLARIEVDEVIKNDPDAAAIRETLFAESLASGRPAQEIWQGKYKPLVEVGKKAGVEQLQQTKKSQPVKATSTASESDLKIDPTKLSLQELEKLIPKGQGF